MNALKTLCVALPCAVLISACDTDPRSSRGFALPDGDAAAGKQVFVEVQCVSCHSVKGLDDLREGVTPVMTLQLGGKTPARMKSYGELVTSIVNPSHVIAQFPNADVSQDGQSMMRNYNDEMTVTQLIDLVAFVQSQYEVLEFGD